MEQLARIFGAIQSEQFAKLIAIHFTLLFGAVVLLQQATDSVHQCARIGQWLLQIEQLI